MIELKSNMMIKMSRVLYAIKLIIISILIFCPLNINCLENNRSGDTTSDSSTISGVTYSNPRVYNLEYSFELVPDPTKIDRTKDLKLWLPIPREWDSQKSVKIISVQPPTHASYEDPEYGNRMLYWDFGKEPEDSSYKVIVKCRLESFEIHTEVDPKNIGSYNKMSKEYELYTRSTHTISITPKIKELAQIAIGEEANPYLQAKRIIEYVGKKVYFKVHDFDRGRGIQCLLDYPEIDEDTGEEYYEGCCNQKSAFFIALCRAVGIPARSVQGMIRWKPWVKVEDLKPVYDFETKLSPSGLAGAQDYGALSRHTWAEFYLPNYGWIPADPTSGQFGNLDNEVIILSKGRDIIIGPEAPQKGNEGYGVQWVPINNGRADLFTRAVWNIAKIRIAKMKSIHYSDPFPADALADYPIKDSEKDYRIWRKFVLSWPSYFALGTEQNLDLKQIYQDDPRVKPTLQPFAYHMLRIQLGDEKFFKLINTYLNLRQKSNQEVSLSHFQRLTEEIYGDSLDWFFKQWVNNSELPRLKLENVVVSKARDDWQIKGRILQLNENSFYLPVEVAIDTKNGREKKNLWVDKNSADFDIRIKDKPQKLVIDPDYKLLKLQKMPPRFWWMWDVYPNYIIIYGTLAETNENKTAAEQLNKGHLGLGQEIIKADTEVNETDLKSKCVILFGRPETNIVSQNFRDIFPVQFNGDRFTWQGVSYDKPTQGVSQIVVNSVDPNNIMIMYAGLSGEVTQNFNYLYLYHTDASYVIFDQDTQLISGDWEEYDSDLVWNFD